MASLQQDPSGNFHVCFRFRSVRFKRSLKTKFRRKAEAAASRIEENIRLIDEGRIPVPVGDVPTYLLSDGKLTEKSEPTKNVKLAEIFEKYSGAVPKDALEATSIATMKIHVRHIVRILGGNQLLRDLQKSDLQSYVTKRSGESGRRGNVSASTIRKELGTLSSLWTWAKTEGCVDAEFPRHGLVFPKTTERPRFQTWEQIVRQIRENDLVDGDAALLWDCLYLCRNQLDQLLKFIREKSRHGCLHPMAMVAAYTGARRSEICRALVSDVDLLGRTFTIQERKRARSRRTTRTVPMCESLVAVIGKWIKEKPKCRHLFPEEHRSFRLRVPNELKQQIKPFEATNFLNNVLSESSWEPIRGWHIFRHSFISNCASNGVDQRFIDQWAGHQTEEQRRRYRHLFPDSQQAALDSVFA